MPEDLCPLKLQQLFQGKKINRRQFITQLTALGVGSALIPSFLAGSARASVPKKGGHFRMGMAGGSTSDSLDVAVLADVIEMSTNYALRNNLVEVDHNGRALPELAESWDVSAGAERWAFNLRRDVLFHNGKTMDARDVVYSIRHHMGKNSKSGAKGLVGQIASIEAQGKYQVVFTLASGNADFPYILNDYHLVIVPHGTTGAEWEKGVGTGGYILEQWEPGVRALLKRNPNYFKSDRAHFDSAEILSISDTNSRTNALRSGQIDYMNRVELKTAHLFKRSPGIDILRVNGGRHYTLPMLTDVPPYDNNHLRLALKYAIDRKALVEKFLRGYGSVANDHPIPPQNKYFAKNLPQRHYDPDKAAFHMKKAGCAGREITLHASELGSFMDVATIFAHSAQGAGIKVKVKKAPGDGYWNNIWLKQPFCTCYWGARPTADMMFSVAYSGDAKWNDTHLKNPAFDQLVSRARAELDEGRRRQMYWDCQKILRNEGGTIIPFYIDYVEAASSKVGHGPLAGAWETDGHRAIERWWFS